MANEAVHGRRGRVLRGGFSLVEIVFVLCVSGILMGVAVSQLQKTTAQRDTISARDAYVWMARRARAVAIQKGLPVRVTVRPAVAAAAADTNGVAFDALDFNAEWGIVVTTPSADSVSICFDPRGLGSACSGAATLPKTVRFTRGDKVSVATVQPLGQVEATP